MGVLDIVPTGVLTGDNVLKLFTYAREHQFAIPAINVTSSSAINAVLEAARDAKSPVIIQISQGGAQFFAGKGLNNDGQAASILGAIAAAHHARTVAKHYGVPVVLHSDHCAKKLEPWFVGMLEADEAYFKEHGEPLFSSHMLDFSEETKENNIAACKKYLTHKQWFVQCDWFNFGISQLATLYTIPISIINHFIVNVTHLKLNLPLGNQFWLSFPSFDRLISLEITFIERSIYISFQILLDRSSRLQSICFSKCSDMEFVSKLTSQSVRRLDFLTKNVYKKYFTKQQCSTLRHSSLGSQCKSLLIPVESRTDVIYLVKSLPNLHSLTFQCKDDPFDDGFLHWFHRHLPSTCSIDRDANQTSHIRLWIR
ncbi:unnamed protein product [Adineta ricciae]|uniref:fructose-bisphosphate aldolase n=1 Tax=Adineta ricciae TaxID=249248 RepID=A0A815GF38_ADIRI|nr:unnamed protein product [Adineta ricciae]